jgi:hypothetical protein
MELESSLRLSKSSHSKPNSGMRWVVALLLGHGPSDLRRAVKNLLSGHLRHVLARLCRYFRASLRLAVQAGAASRRAWQAEATQRVVHFLVTLVRCSASFKASWSRQRIGWKIDLFLFEGKLRCALFPPSRELHGAVRLMYKLPNLRLKIMYAT